ncbi:CD225/dispanin family protein [Gordonia malaquae]
MTDPDGVEPDKTNTPPGEGAHESSDSKVPDPQFGQGQFGAPQQGYAQQGYVPVPGQGYVQPGFAQPGYPVGPPRAAQPDDYLVWAILSTVLCCLPLGVVSIVKSTSVGKLWAMGDYAGAQRASDDAKKFAIWSAVATAVIYVVVIVVYVVFFLVLFETGRRSGTSL